MSHPVGIAASFATGIIGFGLALVSLQAWRRSDDSRMLYLLGAFTAFGIKGILPLSAHYAGWPGHNGLEIWQALLDLTVILLLVAPFLHRK